MGLTMTNKELQEKLKRFPDDLEIQFIEYDNTISGNKYMITDFQDYMLDRKNHFLRMPLMRSDEYDIITHWLNKGKIENYD